MKNECTINLLQVGLFDRIVEDLSDSMLYTPTPGHGHTPLWILGHLAVVAQMGVTMLDNNAKARTEWFPLFGPGSVDPVDAELGPITVSQFADMIRDDYAKLRDLYEHADAESLAGPHSIELFEGTPIATVDHAIALLLTNHFGFHLSQLSAVRRASGSPPLF